MLDFDFSLRSEDDFLEEFFGAEYMAGLTHNWYYLLS